MSATFEQKIHNPVGSLPFRSLNRALNELMSHQEEKLDYLQPLGLRANGPMAEKVLKQIHSLKEAQFMARILQQIPAQLKHIQRIDELVNLAWTLVTPLFLDQENLHLDHLSLQGTPAKDQTEDLMRDLLDALLLVTRMAARGGEIDVRFEQIEQKDQLVIICCSTEEPSVDTMLADYAPSTNEKVQSWESLLNRFCHQRFSWNYHLVAQSAGDHQLTLKREI